MNKLQTNKENNKLVKLKRNPVLIQQLQVNGKRKKCSHCTKSTDKFIHIQHNYFFHLCQIDLRIYATGVLADVGYLLVECTT